MFMKKDLHIPTQLNELYKTVHSDFYGNVLYITFEAQKDDKKISWLSIGVCPRFGFGQTSKIWSTISAYRWDLFTQNTYSEC